MKLRRSLAVLPSAVLACAVACGGSGATTDLGGPGVDSGAPPVDASSPHHDGGTTPLDGSVNPGIDSSTPTDGNVPQNDSSSPPLGDGGQAVQTVFIIMMENHSATSIYQADAGAPYINGTLIPMGAHATAYNTHVHPSEPNYLWLEAGDNLGITDDNDPTNTANQHAVPPTDHLSAQLDAAHIPWKAWVEAIDGTTCPLTSSTFTSGTYGTKHVPQVFFSDVTDNFSASSATCKAHIRPFSELATALSSGNVPRYNFITPDLCDDMHGGQSSCLFTDEVAKGDMWLQANVPTILGSNAFKNGGLLIIAWDEGDEPLGGTASDGPLPFIMIGSMVKTGYTGNVSYTHSSTLKTIEKIFGVPLLRGAADSATNDLSDMFTTFP